MKKLFLTINLVAVLIGGMNAGPSQPVAAASLILRPNPADDVLYLDVEEGTVVSVFDMTGRLVKSERYRGQLDVSRLAPGNYAIKVDGVSLRFIKTKF